MRISQNGLYIESYAKCPNCGILLYENSMADQVELATHEGQTYCSQRCLDWKIDRDKRRAAIAS
jgi:hypothetical protein